MNLYYGMGAVMVLIGTIIMMMINRRRFYRRNVLGLQQFKTYSGSVATRWLERLAKLIAIALILLGIGALAAGYSVTKAKERRAIEIHGHSK